MKTTNLSFIKKISIRMLLLFCAIFCSQSIFASDKPNSKFNGVKIGVITGSYGRMPDQSLEAILEYVLQSGINSVELPSRTVEIHLGMPKTKNAKIIREWRLSVPMEKYKEIGDMFRAKGVDIHTLRIIRRNWSDAEIDYGFAACKAIGAKGIATEISEETVKRLAPFGEKHNLYVILHNHSQPGEPGFSFEKMLSYGSKLMLQFDAGHYVGATGLNPCDLVARLHDRIFSIHVKDKTDKYHETPSKNRPFGEGDTQVAAMLQLIQKEKWPIYCDIELEYKIPENSDALTEVKKCVEFCRKALQSANKSVSVKVGSLLVSDRNVGSQQGGTALNYTINKDHADYKNSSFKGGFYTWDEAQTICPSGWRLPTYDEMLVIQRAMKFSDKRAYLADSEGNRCYFPIPGNENNSARIRGYYWTSTKYQDYRAWFMNVHATSTSVKSNFFKSNNFSVRCVK